MPSWRPVAVGGAHATDSAYLRVLAVIPYRRPLSAVSVVSQTASTSYTTVNGRTVNTHEQAVRSEGMVHVEDWYEDCYRELSQVIECFLILPFLFCDFLPQQSLTTPPSAEPPVLGPLSSTFPTRRCTDELLQQRSAHLHTEHPAHDQDILGARVFRRLVLGGHPPSARAQPTPCEAWQQPADQLPKCDRTLHLPM